ncbi:hypothetical protein [Desulfovibrio ferrophilus]|uniref:Uncharacterized protein n=1 Tax=Desulfovibrio ferrophilus TaxID=241368 RepID=A0A2Z6AX98_9BACT|nr:hypothetical protein [Desulfovibrio ferrophilus]BBD07861.1 uncharacterized protein DFE_1135 [Desulfovibrio ferrophilus]
MSCKQIKKIFSFVFSRDIIPFFIFATLITYVTPKNEIASIINISLTFSGAFLGITTTSLAIIIGVITQKDFIKEVVTNGGENVIYSDFLSSLKNDFLIMFTSFLAIFIVKIWINADIPHLRNPIPSIDKLNILFFTVSFFTLLSLSAMKDVIMSSLSIVEAHAFPMIRRIKEEMKKEKSPPKETIKKQ